MGKYADLKEQFVDSEPDSPEEEKLKIDINNIEEWCITKGYLSMKTTDWKKARMKWKKQINSRFNSMFGFDLAGRFKDRQYPWHTASIWVQDSWMLKEYNEQGVHLNQDGTPHICDMCIKS